MLCDLCRRCRGTVELLAVALICLTGSAGCGKSKDSTSLDISQTARVEPPRPRRIRDARQAIATKNWQAAEKQLRLLLIESPEDGVALEMSGDLAAAIGQPEQSARFYQAAVNSISAPSLELLNKLMEQWTVAGCLFESLAVLDDTVARYPTFPELRFDLAALSTLIGMEQVAMEQLKWLAQHNHGDEEGLIALAAPERIKPDKSMCIKALQRCPDDLRIHFPLALLEASDLQWKKVVERLSDVVERRSDFVEGQILYGRALVELNEAEKVLAWRRQLPQDAVQRPGYWLVAGTWAEKQGENQQAIRAFGEAVQRGGANNPLSLKRLLTALVRAGQGDRFPQLLQRVEQFTQLNDVLDTFDWRGCQSQTIAFEIAKLMETLGRLWEAEGWARMAIGLKDDKTSDAKQRYLAIREKLRADTPWQLPLKWVDREINLSEFPVVEWTDGQRETSIASAMLQRVAINLVDEASQRGLNHTCQVSPEAMNSGCAIYHTSGGGTAVIDFDLDGWPDLSFAMLDGDPMNANSSPNQLFRNQSGQFHRVTELAGIQDHGFAQGITVGDFNDDGFPDLFDANIGRNRLYQNNGDGTFTDVSDAVGLNGEYWTTSAVFADIDNDGLADLFEVQYCGGETPYTKRCPSSIDESRIGSCSPLLFVGETDRVWQLTQSGQLGERTDQWLKQPSPGRGLGVVVGHFDAQDGVDVYVANDMSSNQFWSSRRVGDSFRFDDIAVLRGLAVNAASKSQASMGIAAGDPDNDGDIDFLLTHFAREYNTFYQQESPGVWSDQTGRAGFLESSMNRMGFGTEWADFDRDGVVELIIANGHVNEIGDGDRFGITFAMPAQIYQRSPKGMWAEVDNELLGDYFKQKHVSRALVTLDANRDGQTDVVVTHLFEPISLLINRTNSDYTSQGFVLKATQGQRDAIGAIMTFEMNHQERTVQLLAGDGYMCANERKIVVGMGLETQLVDVQIRWPSGLRESFGDIHVGQDALLIEGSGEVTRLR